MDRLLFRDYCFCLSPLLTLSFKKETNTTKAKRSRLYQTLTDAIFGLGDWVISGQKEKFINQFIQDSNRKQSYR